MNNLKIILGLLFAMYITSAEACRYTIREIGFSTLSKVTYVIYRVDENGAMFPNQLAAQFSESNIKPIGFHLKEDKNSAITKFVEQQQLSFPAYVLVDQDHRMIAITDAHLVDNIMSSPVQKQLLSKLPNQYASVILIEGTSKTENDLAKRTVLKACEHIENIMPNMPKQVEVGPDMIVIPSSQFDKEKVLLWSLGIEKKPEKPIAFVIYGKGRIMGEKIDYESIVKGDVYKLLSIIGADCECGLDRKWMLGYQIPLNWPKKTRQGLSDRLGFDVDNPMVLTEMSRILAIENKVPKDPDGVSFEPVVINLEEEFNDIPEIEHTEVKTAEENSNGGNTILIYSLVVFLVIISIGVIVLLKKQHR
ncbi:hypothetical protein [Flavivirga spongiicola]|uniref:Uncharacterized protein n=1 Tax=Flavivirga spongiicola TaxID=421621 RepID=A0ABU7XNQ6_9FLAO|nr:hypothetical protein [Flavivirga sp. MEBiC05379]MDO5977407.1 hypothetical protein [Flavivirga sp. MEBiC05379]